VEHLDFVCDVNTLQPFALDTLSFQKRTSLE